MNRVVDTPIPSIEGNAEELLHGDPTRFYRYEIGRVELLTADEVTRLAQRIEQGRLSKQGDEEYMRRVVDEGHSGEEYVRYQRRVSQARRVQIENRQVGNREMENVEVVGESSIYRETQRKTRKKVQDVQYLQEVQSAEEARRQLIEANLRLVVSIAKRYGGYGMDMMDLVQEGNLGLMHAVEKYDSHKGCKFSTYATWWIRQYITRALATQSHAIRVPLYKIEALRRLGRVRQELQQFLDTEPTLEMLAEQMSMNVQQVIALLSTGQEQETISLDLPRKGGDEEVFLSDIIEDDPVYMPEQVVLSQTLQEQVQELLNCLSQREKRVVQLRFGLNGQREHSLTEAGKQLGLSHEAVRQVELRALRKLDHLSRSRMLHDFLE